MAPASGWLSIAETGVVYIGKKPTMNYVLAVVLFATALFFAGMAARFRTHRLRVALLAFGVVIVVGTIASLVEAKDYPTLMRAARAVLDADARRRSGPGGA